MLRIVLNLINQKDKKHDFYHIIKFVNYLSLF